MHNLKNNIFKILVIITAYVSAVEMIASPSFYVNDTKIVGTSSEDVDIYLGIPYAEPPSITLTAVIVPLLSTVSFAVACLPVTDDPIETNCAL